MGSNWQGARGRLVDAALIAGIVAATAFGGTLRAADFAVKIVEPDPLNDATWTFDPNTVTIKVGDTVTWTNTGSEPHDVTAADKSFSSGGEGNMPTGATFSFTFTQPGTFAYICQAHPWMTGTVVVNP